MDHVLLARFTHLDAFSCWLGCSGSSQKVLFTCQGPCDTLCGLFPFLFLSPVCLSLNPKHSHRNQSSAWGLSLSSRIAGLLYSMVAGFQEWKLQLLGPLKARLRTGRMSLSIGWGKLHGQPRFKGRGNKLPLDGWCDLHLQWREKLMATIFGDYHI